ncbi:hypothetical protein AAFF27_00385 [Xylophilus sp. GW821-FHT01B05]
MKQAALRSALERLVTLAGIRGCALVESESGLVLLHHGEGEEALWEAAVDYWRMHHRLQAHFAALGPLSAAVMYHVRGALAVMPCQASPPLLVICVGELRQTDWVSAQKQVRALSQQLAAPSAP